jgi:hypothetical protein
MGVTGAVLIGPFEGSRWRGGCGGELWDLDRAIRRTKRFCRSSEEHRNLGKVSHQAWKGMLDSLGEASLKTFADKRA